MKTKKIGIIGHGFVGKAMDKGFNTDIEKFIVDPKIGTTIKDLNIFKPEFIFICVPTPMDNEGNQDNSILEKVLSDIEEGDFSSSVLILKSTVLPDKTEELEKRLPNFVYNPEFLRENFAEEDFRHSEFIILGGEKENCDKVKNLYLKHSVCKADKYIYTDAKKASFTKYIINTFLALKVAYFNELNELLDEDHEDWTELVNIIMLDKRIGASHMDVPGPDGRKGFGGACFPKDTNAFVKYSMKNGKLLDILDAAIKKNNLVRSSYKKLSSREKDQNVNFEN